MGRRTTGPRLTMGLVSNPYPPAKDHQGINTICELCHRTIKTKDWGAHKRSKAHRALEKKMDDESKQLHDNNADGFVDHSDTADSPGGWGNDLGNWGGGSGDAGGFDDGFGDGNGNDSGYNVQKSQNGGPGACYGCGEVGHNKRDCPSTGASRGCYNCGEQGHIKAACPNPSRDGGGGGGGGACYNCGLTGHMKSACTEPYKASAGDRACHKCGETGHLKFECPNGNSGGGSGQCFNCYQTGHNKRDCTNERVMKCRNCDDIGHMSKECPKPKDWSRVICNNCKKSGHTMTKCEEPIVEDAGDSWDNGNGDTTSTWAAAPANEFGAPAEPSGEWDSGDGGAHW